MSNILGKSSHIGPRKDYIDLLKTIGIFGIIAAHVGSPQWVMMIRNFDVPLLVILSGLLSRGKSKSGWIPYVFKRVKRLLIPTYVFLTFYFTVTKMLGGGYTKEIIVKSYLLRQDGIGFVWIIWVYLLCAIFTPLLDKISVTKKSILCFFAIYILYEISCRLHLGTNIDVLYYTIYYYPYIFLTFLGLHIEALNKKMKIGIAISASVLFTVIAGIYFVKYGAFIQTQIFKYPPRLYYLSYAVAVTMWLVVLFQNITRTHIFWRIVDFISSHSLWIYLWHIFSIFIANYLMPNGIWWIKYIFVLSFSCILTSLQSCAVDAIDGKVRIGWLKYFQG